MPTTEIRPQEGPQTQFLSTNADIAIYGGQAGGGKTWALLLDPLRHVNNGQYGAVYFRRSFPQITNEGGLWDESSKLYSNVPGAVPKPSALQWTFKSGSKITFKHMQHEETKNEFQGSQIPTIYFDELTHFSRGQFMYMLSRNRSTCGVNPYMRGSCNPDPNSWVKGFLAPYLDRKFIQPGEEEPRRLDSGELAYFSNLGGMFKWHSQDEFIDEKLTKREEDRMIKSLCFIRASVFDNRILLATNPQYLSNLRALPLVEQERLLHGNWDIVEQGNMFRQEWFAQRFLHEFPTKYKRLVRFWDFASTKPSLVGKKKDDPDYSAGVLVGLGHDDYYYVIDLVLMRDTPREVEKRVYECALSDADKYGNIEIYAEQEPGASGEFMIHHLKTEVLKGFRFEGFKSTGSKIARAKPVSAEVQRNGMTVSIAPWNESFFAMLTAFYNEEVHDDVVDALSGAYNVLNAPPDELVWRPRMGFVASSWTNGTETRPASNENTRPFPQRAGGGGGWKPPSYVFADRN